VPFGWKKFALEFEKKAALSSGLPSFLAHTKESPRSNLLMPYFAGFAMDALAAGTAIFMKVRPRSAAAAKATDGGHERAGLGYGDAWPEMKAAPGSWWSAQQDCAGERRRQSPAAVVTSD
jgi:hypothetical protein